MTMNWLLDATVFSDYHDELVAAIERNGDRFVSINRPNPPYDWDDTGAAYRKAFPAGARVVTHADMDLVMRVRADQRWAPGVFATIEHFFCSHYYPHFAAYLLNRDYTMLPFDALRAERAGLFAAHGRDEKIFVRPDSPLKLFAGQLVADATFEKDLDFLAFYDFPGDTPVIVSSPKPIEKEWRFVIAGSEIVASSLYKDGAKFRPVAGCDDDGARQLAESVLALGYAPDAVWVMDICQSSGKFYLLEIGAFSFSNLYACDKDAVVRAVSQIAGAHSASSDLS